MLICAPTFKTALTVVTKLLRLETGDKNKPERQILWERLLQLNKTELKILELIAEDLSIQGIAARLYLSVDSVLDGRESMANKLKLTDPMDLADFAKKCKDLNMLKEPPNLYPTEN